MLVLSVAGASPGAPGSPGVDSLLDWSPWQKYRTTAAHPAVTIKTADLARARENIRQYAWGRRYRDGLLNGVKGWPARLIPEYLAQMIPAATPGDTLFTPCPACRDLGKPVHPHGQWRWSPQHPEQLTCMVCGTVFPNGKYPESIVRQARLGGGQQISYCGGEPFRIFQNLGRPSFTAAIRAQGELHGRPVPAVGRGLRAGRRSAKRPRSA